ncbi:MAG TPA: hypothetical protein VK427_18655 [Kofleriaceae bacterium]|nr:hypothetical protein [Kofleriaceae bacterium]
MRLHLVVLTILGGCGSDDKTVKHFCQNVRLVFHEAASGELGRARRALEEHGRCSDLHEATSSLRAMKMSFTAAATPFRRRSEVDKALTALDQLTLDELGSPMRCIMKERDSLSTAEVDGVRAAINGVEKKLAAVVATCPPR